MRGIVPKTLRILRAMLALSGCGAMLVLLLACTVYPYRMYRWLSLDHQRLPGPPDWIVMLGGSGVPGASALVRSYQASAVALRYPQALVLISMPEDPAPGSQSDLMKREFVMRGVDEARIRFGGFARNTREEALVQGKVLGVPEQQPATVLVTSPNHLKRSLLAFRKAGFQQVYGAPAYEVSIPMDPHYSAAEMGGTAKAPVARLGESMFVRYEFWNNLALIGQCAREYLALAYYWAMDWI